MKIHTIIHVAFTSIVLLCADAVIASSYDDVDYTTSSIASPGKWNTNFTNSLAYAKANHIPVIMYYGVYGCTYAEKGVRALNQQILKDWFADNDIVMIYKRVSTRLVNSIVGASSAKASVDPDLWLGREWVKNNSGVANYPIMRIYWNKPDGSNVVSKTFSLRYKQMPVKTPAGSDPEDLAGQLLGTLKMYLADYVPGAVTPETEDDEKGEEQQEEEDPKPLADEEDDDDAEELVLFGTKSLTYKGGIWSDDGDLIGFLTATAAKASSTGKIKISGTVKTVLGKNYTFSTQTTKEKHAISLENKNVGQIDITFSDTAMTGTVDDCEVDCRTGIGGQLSAGKAHFTFADALPVSNGVYTIVHDALPTNEALTVTAKTIRAGTNGSVKWNSKAKEIVVSEVNPSALKLSYTSSTGIFKGSFKVWQYKSKTNSRTGAVTGATFKKVSANIFGFIVDDGTDKKIGIGTATISGFTGSFDIAIEFDDESDD